MKKVFFDLGPGVLRSEAWRNDMWGSYKIIGVEADPTRYAKLKDVFPGTLLNIAVSDQIGEISGVLHPTSGFIVGGYPGYKDNITIKTVTLDSLDQEYGPFNEVAIWADIEGSELRMLYGATEVLKKTNWINIELHTAPKTDEWARSHDVFTFLTNLGFKPNILERPQTLLDSNYDILFTRCYETNNDE